MVSLRSARDMVLIIIILLIAIGIVSYIFITTSRAMVQTIESRISQDIKELRTEIHNIRYQVEELSSKLSTQREKVKSISEEAVSYTHLTLPTN